MGHLVIFIFFAFFLFNTQAEASGHFPSPLTRETSQILLRFKQEMQSLKENPIQKQGQLEAKTALRYERLKDFSNKASSIPSEEDQLLATVLKKESENQNVAQEIPPPEDEVSLSLSGVKKETLKDEEVQSENITHSKTSTFRKRSR